MKMDKTNINNDMIVLHKFKEDCNDQQFVDNLTVDYMNNMSKLLNGDCIIVDIIVCLYSKNRKDLVNYILVDCGKTIDLSLDISFMIAPDILDYILSINTSSVFHRNFIIYNLISPEIVKMFISHNITFKTICESLKYPINNATTIKYISSMITDDCDADTMKMYYEKIYGWQKYDLYTIKKAIDVNVDVNLIFSRIYSSCDNLDIMNYLFDHGCTPDNNDLDYMFARGCKIFMLKILIERGIPIEDSYIDSYIENSNGDDDIEFIELLVDNVIDPYELASKYYEIYYSLAKVLSARNVDWNIIVKSIVKNF